MQEQPLWTTGMAERAVDPPQEEQRQVESGGPRWFSVLALFAFLLALRFVVPYLAEEVSYAVNRGRERAAYEVASSALAEQPFNPLMKGYQSIAKRVSPSVVNINVRSVGPRRVIGDGIYYDRLEQAEGQGSGVIMDERGYIVTNFHVIRNAREIEVSLSDGRRVPAKIVGADQLTDIAVIKIEAGKLIPAEWGDSDRLEVGSLVWALGSPFGLQNSITHGILSAKNRSQFAGTPFQDFLQTDAAVNQGNSGGPLVDASGNVVGINTAIIGESYQGISFAVPSSVAQGVYQKLIAGERVQRGWLGVEMEPVGERLAEVLGVRPEGAFVKNVVERLGQPSPAHEAGVRKGDVIVGWNDKPIKSPLDLSRAVASTPVGEVAKVHVIRQGGRLELDVQVGLRPPETE